MKILSYRIGKQTAVCLVLSFALTMSEVAQAAPSPVLNPQQAQNAPAQDPSQNSATQTQTPQSTTPQAPASQSTAPVPGSDQSQSGITKPVGTAAAPSEPVTGVAATRPVGAAIAPAKQRRARTILIRMSIVIGAAVAIGTVVALSKASPSRPN